MTAVDLEALRRTLDELAADQDPLVSRLASSLTSAAGDDSTDLSGPPFREAREMISALADQQKDPGSGELIAALVTIDEGLAARKAVQTPWASRLAPLAAERARHAALERWNEQRSFDQAERSPIFRLEERTVLACPVSPLGDAGLSRFVDRVLAEVLRTRTKRVVLVSEGLTADERVSPSWEALARDLETQLVRLERG